MNIRIMVGNGNGITLGEGVHLSILLGASL